MSFAPGVGAHFRILRALGADGMGEVCLAEDTRLKRNVALEFLPDAVVAAHERLKRLLREAEELATLDHSQPPWRASPGRSLDWSEPTSSAIQDCIA